MASIKLPSEPLLVRPFLVILLISAGPPAAAAAAARVAADGVTLGLPMDVVWGAPSAVCSSLAPFCEGMGKERGQV